MNVKDAIQARRSIRKYEDKPVSESVINDLLDAARLAPSGHNSQPWRYKIVSSPEDKELLKTNNVFKQDFVYKAPVIIVCCTDPNSYSQENLDPAFDDVSEVRAVRDLAISSQNLVLMATELGLGTCYIGWMNKAKIKEVLGLPENYIVPYAITVGYPTEKPGPRNRLSIDEVVI